MQNGEAKGLADPQQKRQTPLVDMFQPLARKDNLIGPNVQKAQTRTGDKIARKPARPQNPGGGRDGKLRDFPAGFFQWAAIKGTPS